MLPRLPEEAEALSVGREVEVLVAARAVGHGRVGASLALDGVAAVARIPDEAVAAGAEDADVAAAIAVHEVILRPAEEQLDAGDHP